VSAGIIKFTDCWNVAHLSLVKVCRIFVGGYCLHQQGDDICPDYTSKIRVFWVDYLRVSRYLSSVWLVDDVITEDFSRRVSRVAGSCLVPHALIPPDGDYLTSHFSCSETRVGVRVKCYLLSGPEKVGLCR
jgi:hypothetical protein